MNRKIKIFAAFILAVAMVITLFPAGSVKADVVFSGVDKLCGEPIKVWNNPGYSNVLTDDGRLLSFKGKKFKEEAKNVKDYSPGILYFLSKDGRLYRNAYQILGYNKKVLENIPEKTVSKNVESFTDYKRGEELLYIKKDKTLWLYGRKDASGKTLPDKKIADNVIRVWVSHEFSDNINLFAIKADGSLWGAGTNALGDLGIGNKKAVPIEKPIKIMDGIKDFGYVYSDTHILKEQMACFAIKKNGDLYTWGSESEYYSHANTPTPKKLFNNVKSISSEPSVSGNRLCMVTTDGKLYTIGAKLGETFSNKEFDAEPVLIDTGVSDVVTSLYATYYIKNDKSLWYVGNCNFKAETKVPQKIMENVISFSTDGGSVSSAIDTDGYLWQWGDMGSYGISWGNWGPLITEIDKSKYVAPTKLFKVASPKK